MINFIQKIALSWYQVFDATGLMFDSIKQQSKVIRYIIYLLFPLAAYFFFFYMANIIDLQHSQIATEYPIFAFFLLKIGKVTFWAIVVLSSFIATYESILNLNIAKIIKAKKEQIRYVKKHKLQWWRLRNMSLLLRLIVYTFMYFILLQFLQFFTTNALMQMHLNFTEIEDEYRVFLSQISIIYFISVGIIEFLVNRVRKQKG